MPPENAGYAVAAYMVAAVILVGYTGRCSAGQRAMAAGCRRVRRRVRPEPRRAEGAAPPGPAYRVASRFGSSTCSHSSAATIPPRIGPIQ